MALTVPAVIYAQGPLANTLDQIRKWLDREKIEPLAFKTLVGQSGIGFEISFRTEREAERFQEQFPALVA